MYKTRGQNVRSNVLGRYLVRAPVFVSADVRETLYILNKSLLCVDLVTCTINALLKYFKLNHLHYGPEWNFHQLQCSFFNKVGFTPSTPTQIYIVNLVGEYSLSLSLSLSLSGTMPGIHGENQ